MKNIIYRFKYSWQNEFRYKASKCELLKYKLTAVVRAYLLNNMVILMRFNKYAMQNGEIWGNVGLLVDFYLVFIRM